MTETAGTPEVKDGMKSNQRNGLLAAGVGVGFHVRMESIMPKVLVGL